MSDFEFTMREDQDGVALIAVETIDSTARRFHETVAAQEDERIRRTLISLGWTPPPEDYRRVG